MSKAAAAPEAAGRRRVLDAATARFAREGTLQTRLTDIAADAGISIGAIYHHFADKQALADAVVEDSLGAYQEAFLAELERHADARHGIAAIVSFHIDWCESRPEAARMLLHGAAPAASELNAAFFERVLRWYRLRSGDSELQRLPIRAIYALWLGPATAIVRDRLEAGGRKPSRAEVDALAAAAWRSLSAPTAGG